MQQRLPRAGLRRGVARGTGRGERRWPQRVRDTADDMVGVADEEEGGVVVTVMTVSWL